MDTRIMAIIGGVLIAGAACAAPGEEGGAYGGDTTGKSGAITFERADSNGDGKVSEREARLVGIERFQLVDRNHDGVLDEAEIAALEQATDGVRTPAGDDHEVPPGAR